MNLLIVTYAINGLLMILMPIGLGIFLARRFKLGWRLFWIGAATFVLSQVGHIPFNAGATLLLNRSGMVYWPPAAQAIFNAVFLGLSAGLWEEGMRYIVLRWWAREARSWGKGMLVGNGHGGMEAMRLGFIFLLNYVFLLVGRTAGGLQSLVNARLVAVNDVGTMSQQIAAFWSVPWYSSLLGAVERLFTIPCHIAMALMVMQVFTRKNIGWLFAAIGYHALLDGLAVTLTQQHVSAYGIEALVGGFAILSVVIIFLLRRPEPPVDLEPAPVPAASVPAIKPVEESQENLDGTRFQ